MTSEVVMRSKSPQEAIDLLTSVLDLSMVRSKLADPNEGKGYKKEQLDLREAEYRKFLAMHIVHPGTDIVPCRIVDEFWHQHILDTIAYRSDCQTIFGSFLDHFPYFGMRGQEDADALADAYQTTLELYEGDFGTPPEGTWISADAASCKRTNCKPQKCK